MPGCHFETYDFSSEILSRTKKKKGMQTLTWTCLVVDLLYSVWERHIKRLDTAYRQTDRAGSKAAADSDSPILADHVTDEHLFILQGLRSAVSLPATSPSSRPATSTRTAGTLSCTMSLTATGTLRSALSGFTK